ncbi:MAG: hypothetical protein WBP82_02835 [Leuconostoc mesenteroides]
MAFTFTNYQPSSMNEYPLKDIIGKVLGGYTDMTKAQYLKPGLEEELKKAKLYNQYYAPNIESEIGLRKAQTGESGARTGLIGEQTKGTRIENQYMPEKMKAQIAELQANSQKARLLQMIRERMMGGGQLPGGQQGGMPGGQMGMFQGQGMPMGGEPQGQPMQQPQQQMPQQPPQGNLGGMDYAQAATAMQMLGLGKPHVVDANGKYMAITPFGNIDTGVHGLSEKDRELSKLDARKVGALEDIVLNNSSKLDTFGELNGILGSEQFEAMRKNPALGQHELGWYSKFGTPEQQDMVGKAQTYMGNIIKDSARDFAGQFRVGEQALLNNMKPNLGDSLDVMKGKAEALTFLTTMMTKRAEMEADLIRNQGMSPLAAKIATDKVVNPKQLKEEIHTILHPARRGEISREEAIAELERRKAARQQ